MTNQTGQVYAFERDAAGRVVSERDFDGSLRRYAYDGGAALKGEIRDIIVDFPNNKPKGALDELDKVAKEEVLSSKAARESLDDTVKKQADDLAGPQSTKVKGEGETPSEKGKRANEVGNEAEDMYREQNNGKSLQNKSGHGIDFYDEGPPPVFKEIKTALHDTENPSYSLSKKQSAGGEEYVDKVLREMKGGKGRFANYSKAEKEILKEKAIKLNRLIKKHGAEYKLVKIKQQPDGSLKVIDEVDWKPPKDKKQPFRKANKE